MGQCEALSTSNADAHVHSHARTQAFFRDRKKRNIYTAHSNDDGKTWSDCKATVLPNNNAGIHAWQMRSGRIAIVYNPQTDSRDPLSISLSEDGGNSFKYVKRACHPINLYMHSMHGHSSPAHACDRYTRVLEHLDGKQEFSYPTIREDKAHDGVIHVSYTFKRDAIKYSRISEKWIMQAP